MTSADMERVLAFVGQLEEAVRGRLPADHWRIQLDAVSVKVQLVGNPPPFGQLERTPDPLGERVGYFFTRDMIATTPAEYHERLIHDKVEELARLAQRAWG